MDLKELLIDALKKIMGEAANGLGAFAVEELLKVFNNIAGIVENAKASLPADVLADLPGNAEELAELQEGHQG